MPVERVQQITERVIGERERFVKWIRSVPSESWSNMSPNGIWQARDYVAHLASIDPLITNAFRAIQRAGQGLIDDDAFSIDEWNEERILERRSRTIDELIDEMAGYRVDLLAALSDFTEEQLDRVIRFGGDNKRAPRDVQLFVFLSAWAFHDRWHMEDARRAAAEEEEQPFGDAAFARTVVEGRSQPA